MEMNWIATAAFGLEGVVGNELKRLGMRNVSAEQGGARFTGTPEDAFKALLWLRSADRVLLILKEGKVFSFEELFQLVRAIPFEKYLSKDGRYLVSGKCARSQLMSIRDCQAITKKALIERLKSVYHLDLFPETRESYQIDVSIHNDMARITLDASGEALNKRGYRVLNGEAAIRETLAAALLQLSPWRRGMPLYDPCCGTGTLLIEAAMITAGRAPGLKRDFAMEAWRFTAENDFSVLRAQAQSTFDSQTELHITGSDIDPNALSYCKKHIMQAGFSNRIKVSQQDLRDLTLPDEKGVFILNPPYGERLSDKKSCEALYRQIGQLMKRHPHYALCAIVNDPSFERLVGRRASKKRRLYNGRLECEYLIFD